MHDIFIRNLPVQLSSSIQEQYNALLPVFKSYAQGKNGKYYSAVNNNYDIGCFMLGLAIIYKTMIIPLAGANLCLDDFRRRKSIDKIKIGKYFFSSRDHQKIGNMLNDLNKILIKYSIPENILLFSDVKEFARNLNVYLLNKNG